MTRAPAVMQGLPQNNEKFDRLLFAIKERLPRARTTACAMAPAHARVESAGRGGARGAERGRRGR